MFDHVGLWVSDRGASEAFYRTVLGALGLEQPPAGGKYAEWEDFAIGQSPDRPVTRNLHVGFAAPDRKRVDAFWQAGIDAGYRDDGAPGPRPQYGDDYYGGFLLDPDGNSAEAALHDNVARGVTVDHLWIRVADVGASAAFYDALAGPAGLRRGHTEPGLARFRGPQGSFSLVAGEPRTENLHIAFPAPDRAAVDAFHAAGLAAGYRDNGPPGERPEYHRGYYAAYLLDPDGHNVESVHHS